MAHKNDVPEKTYDPLAPDERLSWLGLTGLDKMADYTRAKARRLITRPTVDPENIALPEVRAEDGTFIDPPDVIPVAMRDQWAADPDYWDHNMEAADPDLEHITLDDIDPAYAKMIGLTDSDEEDDKGHDEDFKEPVTYELEDDEHKGEEDDLSLRDVSFIVRVEAALKRRKRKDESFADRRRARMTKILNTGLHPRVRRQRERDPEVGSQPANGVSLRHASERSKRPWKLTGAPPPKIAHLDL